MTNRDEIPEDVIEAARVLNMRLHSATELGQKTQWIAEALMEARKAALCAAEQVKPYGYVYESTVRYCDGRGTHRKVDFSCTKKNISDDDIEEFEISETALYDRPQQPTPSVAVKAISEEWFNPANAVFRKPMADDALSAKVQDVAVAEIVSKHGDPEAFGERELVALVDIQKFPYRTKLYAAAAAPSKQEIPGE